MGYAYRLFVKPLLAILLVLGVYGVIFLGPERFPDHRMGSEAILEDDPDRLALYLARGLDPDDLSRWRSSPRAVIGRTTRSPSREGGATGDAQEPLLALALRRCNAGMAGMLLAAGADVNARDRAGSPALVLAAVCGDAALVRALLERGAQVDATDASGETALWERTNLGWRRRPLGEETVRLLEEAGAARPVGP